MGAVSRMSLLLLALAAASQGAAWASRATFEVAAGRRSEASKKHQRRLDGPRPEEERADLAAGAGSTVFADGFESGDLCAWSGGGVCGAPSSISGTWVGSVDLAGARPSALELAQRADGSVLGYLLGAPPYRTVVSGLYQAGTLELDLELENLDTTRLLTLTGPVSGDQVTAVLSGDAPPQTVTLRRVASELDERRFVVLDATDDSRTASLAFVVDALGSFVSGGFVGDCRLWSCEGWVTGLSEAGDTITLTLDDESGCAAGSTATLTFDALSGLYGGAFDYHTCVGSESGSMIGALASRTNTVDVATVLGTLGAVADQLEARVAFVAPHPAFAPDYAHNGIALASLFDEWNAEISAHAEITEDLVKIRTVSTVDDPRVHPALRRHLGVELDEIRTGDGVVLRDSRGNRYYQLQGSTFRVWEDSGGLRIAGNRQPALDLPFDYTVIPGSPLLEAPTALAPLSVSVGGYAAHTSPLTGHSEGNAKADLVAILPADDSELTELVGDGDGIREDGEIWGYWGGGSGELIRDRNVPYIARHDGEVQSIRLEQATTAYFDAAPQWRLLLRSANGVEIDFVHLGSFPAAFAARVLAATGCAPNDLASCSGVSEGDDLLDGLDPIDVTVGEALAYPQIAATELPASPSYPPGYYVGFGAVDVPWAEMEFFVRAPLLHSRGSACVFRLLEPERAAAVAAAMHLDMLAPDSRRYVEHYAAREWGWRAEGALCNAETVDRDDFSSIDTGLGGWFERDEPATTADEIFSIFPIATDTPVYDSALYDSAAVAYLALRDRASGPFSWEMPDGSTVMPFYPLAEVLERTASTLLLKWRELGYTAGDMPVYQRATFLLDSDGLKIAWGPFADTPEAAAQPVLTGSEPCDDALFLCYDHTHRPGL